MQFNVLQKMDGKEIALPFKIDCQKCMIEGLDFDIRESINSDLSHKLLITINRTLPTQIFCVFVSVLLLIIALLVSLIIINALKDPFRPETNTLSFVGALVFAIPVVRNLQPGVPPMGVSIDYFGFFEVEFVLVIALIVIIFNWLYKPEDLRKR